ncbi:LysE family translocator [Nocardioides terrisoli]|uniref:LysE family translocator n=1 Tax=Nocardioides terrisoli TaxID=3388267 RepID=UPI00287B700F|nr:LysE family translocator [Nocardioides marmorisolisilvae]
MLVSLAAFTVAALLVVLLPGPDTLVVVRSILRGGRRQGVLTALGNLCGLTVWVIAAALGLAAMLKASEIGYDALRVVGAAYLAWLGIQAWRSRGQVETPAKPRAGVLGTGFRAGILTNLINPKVGVFFVAFLPGFIPKGDPVGWMSLLFGAIFVVLTAAYWVVLLGLAGRVARWMSTPAVRRRIDTATALVFIGFGVRLATE